jgi:hypothetical protein
LVICPNRTPPLDPTRLPVAPDRTDVETKTLAYGLVGEVLVIQPLDLIASAFARFALDGSKRCHVADDASAGG